MTSRDAKIASLSLVLGALVGLGGERVVSGQPAPETEIHRACIFASQALDAGYGIEVCGRAAIASSSDGGIPTIVEQGCVSGEPTNPEVISYCMAAALELWKQSKGVP